MSDCRIDKYLWCIRVYKSRNEATEACKGGKVKISGNSVKPSASIKEGDVIEIRKGALSLTYKVIQPLEKRLSASLVAQYAENLTPAEEYAKLSAPVESFFFKRDRGAGRPTKKDRRQMDSVMEDFLNVPTMDADEDDNEESDGDGLS